MQDLLFLSQRIPYPPDKGDKTRSYHFLRHLCERHRVHLGCFVDDPADQVHLPVLRDMVASLCALPLDRRWGTLRSLRGLATGQALSLPYYYDRRMARWVRQVLGTVRPSMAFLFSSPVAQYLDFADLTKPARVVMDFCDVDSVKWRQYADRRRGPMAWIYRREALRLLAFERAVAEGADASLFVSAPECALFRSLAPESGDAVHVVENGLDADYFSPGHRFPSPYGDKGPVAVFTGAMDYWPNIDAVQWFVAEVLPRLRHGVPAARFFIVGSNPAPEVRALAAAEGVTVTGRVPDVRPYLSHAGVVVAPLRTARGIQNKVLEGMSMARPVVATPQAHEGIEAEDGRHLLVAGDGESFAAAIQRLFAGSGDDALGPAARRRVLELYDWPSRFRRLDRLLEPAASMVHVHNAYFPGK
jgi:sugar transferase (PEP-CTERM/EpsH1 system associated)